MKKPMDLSNLMQENEVKTSSKSSVGMIEGSAQVSVRLDGARYTILRKIAKAEDRTHKDIMIEAFDLWLKEKGHI